MRSQCLSSALAMGMGSISPSIPMCQQTPPSASDGSRERDAERQLSEPRPPEPEEGSTAALRTKSGERYERVSPPAVKGLPLTGKAVYPSKDHIGFPLASFVRAATYYSGEPVSFHAIDVTTGRKVGPFEELHLGTSSAGILATLKDGSPLLWSPPSPPEQAQVVTPTDTGGGWWGVNLEATALLLATDSNGASFMGTWDGHSDLAYVSIPVPTPVDSTISSTGEVDLSVHPFQREALPGCPHVLADTRRFGQPAWFCWSPYRDRESPAKDPLSETVELLGNGVAVNIDTNTLILDPLDPSRDVTPAKKRFLASFNPLGKTYWVQYDVDTSKIFERSIAGGWKYWTIAEEQVPELIQTFQTSTLLPLSRSGELGAEPVSLWLDMARSRTVSTPPIEPLIGHHSAGYSDHVLGWSNEAPSRLLHLDFKRSMIEEVATREELGCEGFLQLERLTSSRAAYSCMTTNRRLLSSDNRVRYLEWLEVIDFSTRVRWHFQNLFFVEFMQNGWLIGTKLRPVSQAVVVRLPAVEN